MPCLFGGLVERLAMALHACTLNNLASEFRIHNYENGSVKMPLVLAGDFNIKASDKSLLEALKIGQLSDEFATLREQRSPDLEKDCAHFRSAYASSPGSNGKEPEFTNNAWPKFIKEPFRETIDYILCADGAQPNGHVAITVDGVRQLPTSEDSQISLGSLPDAGEPSDHLLLAAELSFALKQV